MPQKIIVSVSNDLVSDQRVHKVCSTLMEMGFKILLLGRKFHVSEELQRPYETHRFSLLFNKGPLFYAEFNIRLFCFLLIHKKCILLSNDLDTLLPNFLISKLKGNDLIYDSHELFPEVPELQNRPFVKKLWELIERLILPKIKHAYTVCRSIADHYRKQYGLQMQVIRNVPFREANGELPKRTKTLIYQGGLNPGRGLELAIDALKYLKDYTLMIVGEGETMEDLKQLAAECRVADRVDFVGRVPYEQLSKYTAKASVGLLLEEPVGLSFQYALPNKLFDYIHADLPFIASDLIEVRNIVHKFGVGQILKERTPKALAKQIESLPPFDKNCYDQAKTELCWQKEQYVLKEVIDFLL